MRRAAIVHLGSLKDKGSDRSVYTALVRVANESSFGAKTDAFGALGNYGDPSAIKTLTPWTNASLHFVRRAAERAINQLKGKPSSGE